MAIKFEDKKDDDTPVKKPGAAKPAAAPIAPAPATDPAEPMVPGGLPFAEPANVQKPKRKGRSGSSGQ